MLHSKLDHMQYTVNCEKQVNPIISQSNFLFVIPRTITDYFLKETFISKCLQLELWTTVGSPIGDGHMVSLWGKGIKGSEYNGKKIKQRGREEQGKGRQRKVAKAGKRGKGSKKVQEKVRKRFYVMLKIEKMWGRKSNARVEEKNQRSQNNIHPYSILVSCTMNPIYSSKQFHPN